TCRRSRAAARAARARGRSSSPSSPSARSAVAYGSRRPGRGRWRRSATRRRRRRRLASSSVLLWRWLRNGWLVRLEVPAPSARAQIDVGVELLDGALELLFDIGHVHRDLVQQRVTALAEPLQRLGLVGPALDLDHQSPGARRPVRRMRRARRHQHDLALADYLLVAPATLDVLEDHVAPEHVEDLVGRVDVEVAPGVRAVDDHRRELRVLPDDLVADGRLE